MVSDGIKLSTKPSPSFRLRNDSLNAVRLRRVFDLFDRNGDGELTAEEIASALDRLGLGGDKSEIVTAVSSFVPEGRNGLLYEDFERLHRSLGDSFLGGIDADQVSEETDEEDMKEAFKVFDEDGDGFISAAELQSVLSKLGIAEARSMTRVQEMISSVDQNDDGQVDFSEFKVMMQGIAAQM
ncbi:EF hand calcium-binding protein family [Rhynchospora pubera]|uniref:EF hand calcium-binding protein family n=1 Tax=Rhynchospora pubera TaxID=906938 RepID=A0AAV8GJX4_9POAL|nr:EF hand calcium-binding protein family [Rhynchospora pubera]KAJ4781359.1 EF hand calcium-binding protein family [Rhynchospora pubera]KAJ4804580.1 EF hand calcium-binding protein family [Rhynchospora pubera]